MPSWMTWVIGISVFITAIGVLWTKVLKPGAKLITDIEILIPIAQALKDNFADVPQIFVFIKDIYSQFRTNSGSSLKDAMNRTESTLAKNERALELLNIQIEAARQLAERDRVQMQRLERIMDRLVIKTEGDRKALAEDLATDRETVKGVARDLAESHQRADAIKQGPPSGSAGEAADAAAQSSATDARALDDDGS